MNNLSIKSKGFLVLLFFVSIVVDSINGLLQAYQNVHTDIGVVLRLSIMLICLPCILKNKNIAHCLLAISLFFVIALFIWAIMYNALIFQEISTFSRYIYVYFLFAYFYYNWNKLSYEHLLCYIANYASLISIILVFSFVTNIGIASYGGGEYGWGTQGFFYAGNDLGLTLMLSLGFSCLYYIKFKPTIMIFLKISLIAIGSVFIGSRTVFILAPLIYFLFVIYISFKAKRKNFYASLISILILVIIVPRLFNVIYNQLDTFAMNRLTIESLENARTSFTEPAVKYINSLDGISLFIGKGYGIYLNKIGNAIGLESKSAEADVYDVIGPYGYMLGSMFLLFYIVVLFKAFFAILQKKSIDNITYCSLYVIFSAIAVTAGHALTNVMAAPIVAILSVRILKKCDSVVYEPSEIMKIKKIIKKR